MTLYEGNEDELASYHSYASIQFLLPLSRQKK